MDSPSESECSMDGGAMLPPSLVSRDQLQKRIDSLTQQNRVLKVELETYKIRVKVLQEENRALRQASVIIQAKAEQEEEYISNTLLKKIQALKQEKETLAHHYEREEECLTNDLSRKLDQLRQEKCKLEQTLEQEQECLVNKLMRKIEKLEAETIAKQTNLEQLRREMVELENTLEQEQEALVNKLWKRMDKLEAEKRSLQVQLEQPGARVTTSGDAATPAVVAAAAQPSTDHAASVGRVKSQSPMLVDPAAAAASAATVNTTQTTPTAAAAAVGPPIATLHLSIEGGGVVPPPGADQAAHLSAHIQTLRSQVARLRGNLLAAQKDASQKMQQFAQEEKCIREENLRLQRKLQLEVERREALCRHLSESESSLEMEEERHYNENVLASLATCGAATTAGCGSQAQRQRTISSPVPPSSAHSPSHSRPLSPSLIAMCGGGGGQQLQQQQQQQQMQQQQVVVHSPRCFSCGQMLGRRTSERFAKPAIPSPALCLNTSAPNILSSQPQLPAATAVSQYAAQTMAAASASVSSVSGGSSLNSSLSSSFTSNSTLPASSSLNCVSFGENSGGGGGTIVQPASPMDTSVCKD